MTKRLLLPIITLLYVSMTCVHIPVRFNGSGGQIRSPFLLAGANSGYDGEPILPGATSAVSLATQGVNNAGSTETVKIKIHDLEIPAFMRGIYLTNNSAMSKKSLVKFIDDARTHKINTFIIDVQNSMIPREHVEMIKTAGIFPVARVVVFLGGLKQKSPDEKYIGKILDTIDAAAYQGFLEVQLDYIRYADDPEMEKLPLGFKYQTIEGILKKAQEKADSLSVFLSADLFGRVTLNEHDHIGQKLENFSPYMDTIYPMLYPSHYTNDDFRISNPYQTVKEGVENSLRRCENTRIVAYIQGFEWKVDRSGKSLEDYIKDQILAVHDAKGHGWVIWNAKNDYRASYRAISAFDSGKRKRVSETQLHNEDLM